MTTAASTTNSSASSKNNTRPPQVLIFVHGMYGSNLVDTANHNKRVWLSPWTILQALVLGQGHEAATAPTTWSADGRKQDTDSIQPESLSTLNCWAWWGFTQRLGNKKNDDNQNVQVLNYLWDWRRPLEETTAHFLKWLDSDARLNDNRRALLVSYSTGSMIAWAALNQRPELFTGWCSVGGAVGGSSFFIEGLTDGWSMGPLRLLKADTSASFPSLCSFFPTHGEPGHDRVFRHTETKETVWLDTLDPAEWKRQEIGIYSAEHKRQMGQPPAYQPTPQQEQHLANSLAAAKRFRQAHFYRPGAKTFDDPQFLQHPRDRYAHLDICLYGSNSHGTTHRGWWYDGQRILQRGAWLGHGDGTVMEWAWNFVPGGLPSRTVYTDTVHILLLNDVPLHRQVAQMMQVDYEGMRRRGLFSLGVWSVAVVGAALYLAK